MKSFIIASLCLSMTACGTVRKDYTVNGQDLNDNSTSITRKIIAGAAVGLLVAGLAHKGSSGGNCPTPDSIAKDGSRCGNRAASVRPGGQ